MPDPTLSEPEPAVVLRPTRAVVWQDGRLAPLAPDPDPPAPPGTRSVRLRDAPFMIELPWPRDLPPNTAPAVLQICTSTQPELLLGIGSGRQLGTTPCFSATRNPARRDQAPLSTDGLRIGPGPVLHRLDPQHLAKGPDTWQVFVPQVTRLDAVGVACPGRPPAGCTDITAVRPAGPGTWHAIVLADFNGNQVADAGEWSLLRLVVPDSPVGPGPESRPPADAAWGPPLLRVNGRALYLAEAQARMRDDAGAAAPGTGLGGEQPEQPLARALGQLVDEELARQEAQRLGLVLQSPGTPGVDGSPASHGRARVHAARAYADHLAFGAPRATEAELRRHHDSHPERYAQRRWFELEVFDAPAAAVHPLAFEAALIAAPTASRLKTHLERMGLPVRYERRQVASDSLSAQDVRRLASLLPGQGLALHLNGRPAAVFVTGSRGAARSLDDARDEIRRELDSATAQRLLQAQLQRLAGAARIEWVQQP